MDNRQCNYAFVSRATAVLLGCLGVACALGCASQSSRTQQLEAIVLIDSQSWQAELCAEMSFRPFSPDFSRRQFSLCDFAAYRLNCEPAILDERTAEAAHKNVQLLDTIEQQPSEARRAFGPVRDAVFAVRGEYSEVEIVGMIALLISVDPVVVAMVERDIVLERNPWTREDDRLRVHMVAAACNEDKEPTTAPSLAFANRRLLDLPVISTITIGPDGAAHLRQATDGTTVEAVFCETLRTIAGNK